MVYARDYFNAQNENLKWEYSSLYNVRRKEHQMFPDIKSIKFPQGYITPIQIRKKEKKHKKPKKIKRPKKPKHAKPPSVRSGGSGRSIRSGGRRITRGKGKKKRKSEPVIKR